MSTRVPASGEATASGTPIGRDEARHLVDEAIAMSGAEHTTVVLETSNESLTRFANNEIHQNVTAVRRRLTIRAMVGERVGWATTDRVDSSGLRQVADRALALARLSPADPEAPSPAPPFETAVLPVFVDATAACTPEARAD
ncbi:MAG TPA: DNA gyrase modulator, partial [Candidatus Limnocylindria bacterium]|nr:DNA gyrase modulator [Candidatus Limnocylindria bacterium]